MSASPGRAAAPRHDRRATVLKVNEIFHSIQGESRHAGRPCVFVRLTWCNLRCVWCDTAYAFEEGEDLAVGAIADRVRAFGAPYVLVTGGEPLVQAGVHDLIGELLDAGHEVAVETGGSLDTTPLDTRAMVVLDLKCPGSGMVDRNRWENLERLKPGDEVKFVIADRADYEFARDVVVRERLDRRCGAVLFSPVHGELHPRQLSEWVLQDRLPVRVQMQIHKYIWGADVRGV
jgi:7-carboxy-7-deazaguanine synthase